MSPRRMHAHLSQPVLPMIADWQQHHSSSFEEALARQYMWSDETIAEAKLNMAPSSDTFSAVGTIASNFISSTGSANVPSLDRSMRTMSSNTVQTAEVDMTPSERGSSLPSDAVYAQRSPPGVLQCAFAFLGCTEVFYDERDWVTHSSSHFRSQRPPSRSQCPFCESKWQPPDAWGARMDHVAQNHRNERLTPACRADYDLYRHLLNIRVVSPAQYQELEMRRWCDGMADNYTEAYNPNRERRRGAPSWTSTRGLMDTPRGR